MVETNSGTDENSTTGAPQPAAPMPTPPVSPPAPPPGPGASRYEWRAWRHQQRDYVRAQWHGSRDWGRGGWFIGALLVVVGIYYLLFNLGQLTWLHADVLWPVLLIVFGLWLLLSRRRGSLR